MYKVEIVLNNNEGFHARPAGFFVKEASKYKSEIKMIKFGKEYNAKSIMSILSAGVKKGDRFTITANGEDEKEAVEALRSLVDSDFNK